MSYYAVVVDDEHLIRRSLTRKVSSYPAIRAAEAFANGYKCLDWLDSFYADICITDVQMSHMNGLELIHQINLRYPWMVCIVVSSYDDFSYVKTSLQLNAIDYILKPIEQSALNQALNVSVERLRRSRSHQATDILMKHIAQHAFLVERWIAILKAMRADEAKPLIEETLSTMEPWVGQRFYLIKELSEAWLEFVWGKLIQAMALQRAGELSFSNDSDEALREAVPNADILRVFRDAAGRRLEEGATQMFTVLRGIGGNHSHLMVEQVKRYMEAHYAGKISLQDIADSVSFSRTYLANLFKQETGMTVWNYLLVIRMENAKALLNSSLKSYEIAEKVGYDNSIHFSKLFKDYYGLSPMEYRKRILSKKADGTNKEK
jgi:two-component system response regulator YesN